MKIQKAVTLHQAGRLFEAKTAYETYLKKTPRDFDAWHLLGVLHNQIGQPIDAAECLGRALALRPDDLQVCNDLGCALAMINRPADAIPYFERVVATSPQDISARRNLGTAMIAAGKNKGAIEHFQKIIELHPSDAMAHGNLGAALAAENRTEDALFHLKQAVAIKPHFPEAHYNLGTLFSRLGKRVEAIRHLEVAVAQKTSYAEAHHNLGNALAATDQWESAVRHFEKAIALKPDSAERFFSLANALTEQDRCEEAIANYRKALSLATNHADAYSNLLFLHGYRASLPPGEFLSLARGWETACVQEPNRTAARNKKFQRKPLAGRRMKIGYVSGDFRQHAVSYFAEQLFRNHDKSKVELFAYSNSAKDDAVTARLQALVEHWVPINDASDAEVLAHMATDQIDILIDLSGHTSNNRLHVVAQRAAPVQCHYIGFFASTGLTEMDYWIGDEILTPAETADHFSEQLWRLPRPWVSYEGKTDAPRPERQQTDKGEIWLGSFNNLRKLSPATLDVWAALLLALPEGRLLLKTKQFADAANQRRILDFMAERSIPAGRIKLEDGQTTPDWHSHMASYNRLDIALDPVGGVGGGTTTCDALWMAVPVITLMGDRMASRMTASMLQAIGHPEWIARSNADYIDTIVALARNPALRQDLRGGLRSQMSRSTLCDPLDLARSLEDAYLQMFEQWMGAAKNKTAAIA